MHISITCYSIVDNDTNVMILRQPYCLGGWHLLLGCKKPIMTKKIAEKIVHNFYLRLHDGNIKSCVENSLTAVCF